MAVDEPQDDLVGDIGQVERRGDGEEDVAVQVRARRLLQPVLFLGGALDTCVRVGEHGDQQVDEDDRREEHVPDTWHVAPRGRG